MTISLELQKQYSLYRHSTVLFKCHSMQCDVFPVDFMLQFAYNALQWFVTN